jgi:hypothetical protein
LTAIIERANERVIECNEFLETVRIDLMLTQAYLDEDVDDERFDFHDH